MAICYASSVVSVMIGEYYQTVSGRLRVSKTVLFLTIFVSFIKINETYKGLDSQSFNIEECNNI